MCKAPFIITTIFAAILLQGCSKPLSKGVSLKVSKEKAKTGEELVSLKPNSADFEVANEFVKLLEENSIVARSGDGWLYSGELDNSGENKPDPKNFFELPDIFIFLTRKEELSEQAKLDGLQWEGKLSLGSTAFRLYRGGDNYTEWIRVPEGKQVFLRRNMTLKLKDGQIIETNADGTVLTEPTFFKNCILTKENIEAAERLREKETGGK